MVNSQNVTIVDVIYTGLCKHPLSKKLRLWKSDVDRQIGIGNFGDVMHEQYHLSLCLLR